MKHYLLALFLLLASATSAAAQCVGDCNRNGQVTAEEIVFGTNILFDPTLLPQCPSFDVDENQSVVSGELVAAVTDAVEGCPIVPGCGDGCVDFNAGETCDDGGICRGGGRDGMRCNENSVAGCNNNPCPDGVCVPVEGDSVNADACPSNCRIASCSTASGTVDVRINFAVPAGKDLSSALVYLRYPDGVVRIPGSSNDESVLERINVPSFAAFTPNDLNYGLNIFLSLIGDIILPPELFTVTFDRCTGAPAPASTQFLCVMLEASDINQTPISGASCSVEVLP